MTQFLSIRCGLAVIRSRGLRAALVALVTATLAVATTAHAVTIDWVTVGDPGNANDTTGYGAVNYEYRIGKYEVTIGQYAAFLNAVATIDPYSLYNTSMASDLNIAGISRTGSSGSYTYSVINNGGNSANRPVTYVSWFDAARFANWMQNGQGSGSTETGAYTLVGGQTSGTAPTKNPGATFYVPTENEWYKAAYYSPALNSWSGGYYVFSTQSNTTPGNAINAGSNQANYYADGFTVTQSANYSSSQNYLTDAGAFMNSASYFGTFDQTGNVEEWNDLAGAAGSNRGSRGGSIWFNNSYYVSAYARGVFDPSFEYGGVGFRLAAVISSPVPEIDAANISSVLALIGGGLGLLERHRKRS